MGNCCSSTSNEIQQHESPSILQDSEVLPIDDRNAIVTTSTTRSNTPFSVTPDPMGYGAGSSSPSNTMLTATTVDFVDHRLLSLLEFFRQLHVRRRDIFQQIIPVHRQDFEDIFDKMNSMEREEKEHHNMGGMLRQRSMSSRNAEGLKLERFKVKPIDSPNGGKSGAGSKPVGSK